MMIILVALSFWIIRRKRKPQYASRGTLFSSSLQRNLFFPYSHKRGVSYLIIFAISIDLSDEQRTTGKETNYWITENPIFTFEEIIQITQNLRYEIGRGGFGAVYLGNLSDGTKVAVKVLSSSSTQGNKEFEAEVTERIVASM